ncbi:uncharacterized protein L969DRAFT_93950 [Mixia osmundae IAM 14324]|uniref:Uncharacterized protein n=1 Tax=Mixia osmundae (strain CBS 9802 / IAM 14324 / JCM 22182 / KY 12970) TaxID=764103 RepID=G7E8M3_MIXOS|nr:uncharacterized protein L969DRAFT_93950 [Mixia osmundae IAM 14324]KEI40125.1 hypothetical protein L969DRAFT_93950 [Mixia osmundae IAM 14324]GAA99491.1 hypothetical protein E5Q_06191 [Mixia osmundae IAM 14324]
MSKVKRQYVALAGGLALLGSAAFWIYSKAVSTQELEDDSTPSSTQLALPKSRGRRLRASLACPTLPPPSVLQKLSEGYTLHIILPCDAPSDDRNIVLPSVPQELLDLAGFDTRRLLWHSLDEGKLHLTRHLAADVHIEALLPEASYADLTKLTDGIKTFVGRLNVIMPSSGGPTPAGVRLFASWQRLQDTLA